MGGGRVLEGFGGGLLEVPVLVLGGLAVLVVSGVPFVLLLGLLSLMFQGGRFGLGGEVVLFDVLILPRLFGLFLDVFVGELLDLLLLLVLFEFRREDTLSLCFWLLIIDVLVAFVVLQSLRAVGVGE